MQKTQTATKAKPQTATKAKPQTATKAKSKTLFYATLLSEAIAGKFGNEIQRFYMNAVSYHTKQKTTFPRKRLETVELLKPEDARAFIEKHKATSIPAGSHTGQRLFDAMMLEVSGK